MTRIVVGPFNRVEGDLQVQLDTDQGRVQSARVNALMYRGFEQILQGKEPLDAMVIVPRICGICSVSQSVAAARALADLAGAEVPPQGALLGNLIHGVENIADHLTHFYLFFMPDFTHPEYRQRPWYGPVAERFTAIKGTAAAPVLQARAGFMHLMGLFAGKWPHSLCIQPGGVTRTLDRGELLRAHAQLGAFRRFLEQTLYGDSLETVAALADEDALLALADQGRGDLAVFVSLARDLGLQEAGTGPGRLLSYGAYGFGGEALFPAGIWDNGPESLQVEAITEDIAASRLQGDAGPRPVIDGLTLPAAERDGAYSWCKAPRLNGRVMETGALARQHLAGQALIRDLFSRHGASVYSRIVARMMELARVTLAMEDWLAACRPGEEAYRDFRLPDEGLGIGLTEAARGSLGHWLQVRDGRVHNYQIIAPTTWNFSPRDAQGQAGALEQALEGTPVADGDEQPVLVQHIVRSFDPCMVCTVH